jgi:hypothetical protein
MQQRWQDWVGLVLGIVLVLSPWLVGFADMMAAAASAWVIGIAAVILFGVSLWKPEQQRLEWANLVLAVLLILSPFVLGFAGMAGAAWTHWILGSLIGGDAIWARADTRGGQAHGTT